MLFPFDGDEIRLCMNVESLCIRKQPVPFRFGQENIWFVFRYGLGELRAQEISVA